MEKQESISILIDSTLDKVSKYRAGRDFAHLMKFISKCCNLGPYNAMLAYTQNPEATIIMTQTQWKKLFNKGIKEGAHPLLILMPFCPVVFCYDYKDTYDIDGKPKFSDEKEMMKRINTIFRPKGNIRKDLLPNLKKALKYSGVYIDVNLKDSPLSGGYITQKTGPKLEFNINKNKIISYPAQFYININTRASEEEQLMILIHETAHLLLQHLECPRCFEKAPWKIRLNTNPLLETPGGFEYLHTKETEAEIVKEVVCSRNGIDSQQNSITYLAQYNIFLDKALFSQELVMRTICEIEKMLKGEYKLKNGLLYKHCPRFRTLAAD